MIFKKLTIRKKLIGITTLISGTALFLVSIIWVTTEYFREREALVENISVQMRLISLSSRAALMFNDAQTAQGILNALQASNSINHAVILTKTGKTFVTYTRPGYKETKDDYLTIVKRTGPHFSNAELIIHEPISIDNDVVGEIIVQAGLNVFFDDLARDLLAIVFITLPTLFFSFMFASKLYNLMTRPIEVLRKAAIDIGESRFEGHVHIDSQDEIGELAAAFNKMSRDLGEQRKALEQANRAKSEFLANMSHEIRTPMNAVIGLADLALQSDISLKTRDYLLKISNSARSLLRIINDILDFSKIEAGRLELEERPFALRDVFVHIADLFRARVSEKNIELILCVSEECHYALAGDALRLEQILLNLVSNAVKFTETGEIEIQVRTVQEQATEIMLQFSVRDTGPGMTQEQADKIFSPFTQADSSTTRKHGGTGLGLSISQRLVEMMQGHLWVTTAPGQGSTFFFTARFRHQRGVESEEMCIPAELEHLALLVVDDNAAARHAIDKSLSGFGFHVVGAASGREALLLVRQAMAAASPFRLVMADWLMPEMDGITTLRHISEECASGMPPKMVLMVPFNRETEAKNASKDIDIASFMPKPANCSLLFDTIMDVFGQGVARFLKNESHVVDTARIREQIGGAQVLLVEDNAINRQVAEEILLSVGVLVDKAEDGLKAVEKVITTMYDAVLMDIQMPIMDGFQATQKIRDNPQLQELPIIAMTAHAMAGDRERCLAAGMNDHVAKPIDRSFLYAVLINWIRPRPGLGVQALAVQKPETEADPAGFPETLPGINIEAALARIGGKKKLLLSLLKEFYRDHALAADNIEKLLQSQNEENGVSAKQMVHTIKGMAGNLAAMELFEAARSLEKALLAGSADIWPEPLAIFKHAMDRVMGGIKSVRDQQEMVDSEKSDGMARLPDLQADVILPLLQELDRHIQKKDFKVLETFEKVQAILAGSPGLVHDKLAELGGCLDRLDFKKGKNSLEDLVTLLKPHLDERGHDPYQRETQNFDC
ncbi:MAG: response regulator [Magnetococcales bacterium]|nr:response regulator [Magnetococcales bacterium]